MRLSQKQAALLLWRRTKAYKEKTLNTSMNCCRPAWVQQKLAGSKIKVRNRASLPLQLH